MKIVARTEPEPGQTVKIFTPTPLAVGEHITVEHPTGRTTAEVVHDYSTDAHRQNFPLCGGHTVNVGKDYYQIQFK